MKHIRLITIILFFSYSFFSCNKAVVINIGNEDDIGYTGLGILPNKGVCDPHIHIFGDTAYLFASHDTIIGKKNSTYTMMDWNIYSSQDLVHWKKEFVLKPEDTYIAKSIDKCFAIDGATRNGKYYLYFSNFGINTGVAVSDAPGGPYKDMGKPFLAENLGKNKEYDPTIFVDDDGKNYIIWGQTGWRNGYYQIAELNDDMISLKTEPRDMLVTDNTKMKHDASYLHKHNGTYYLSAHKGKYATSKNIYGPYEFRGAVDAHGDHGTYFTWYNQTYYVAGGWQKPYFRYTYFTYAHYKENGEIVAQRIINDKAELGVGRYDCNLGNIEAECFFAASDAIKKREHKTGFEIQNIIDESYLFFPRIYNIPDNPKIEFRIASNHPKAAKIELRTGSTTGKLLGTCKIPNTGAWDVYETVTCKLPELTSPQSIYFVFKGGKGEMMRLDWFKITEGTKK